jgi:hypothetical protein
MDLSNGVTRSRLRLPNQIVPGGKQVVEEFAAVKRTLVAIEPGAYAATREKR